MGLFTRMSPMHVNGEIDMYHDTNLLYTTDMSEKKNYRADSIRQANKFLKLRGA